MLEMVQLLQCGPRSERVRGNIYGAGTARNRIESVLRTSRYSLAHIHNRVHNLCGRDTD